MAHGFKCPRSALVSTEEVEEEEKRRQVRNLIRRKVNKMREEWVFFHVYIYFFFFYFVLSPQSWLLSVPGVC